MRLRIRIRPSTNRKLSFAGSVVSARRSNISHNTWSSTKTFFFCSCLGITVCQKPITSLRSNCGQALSEMSSLSNPAGVSRSAAMNFSPGAMGCCVIEQIPCGLATWYPELPCCLVGAAVLIVVTSMKQLFYHKRPRIRTTLADAELHRAGAFWAMAFVTQPVGGSIDSLVHATAGEMNHQKRFGLRRGFFLAWLCRKRREIELVIAWIAHADKRDQIAGTVLRM